MPLPKTAALMIQPVSAAMACAAATVSQETRFNFSSRCSATTRIVSAIIFWLLALGSWPLVETVAVSRQSQQPIATSQELLASDSLPLLLDVPHGNQDQGQQHIHTEQSAHQH